MADLNKWISVGDRLPKSMPHGETYGEITVIATDGKYAGESVFQWGGSHVGREWAIFSNEYLFDGITHWMPLPEPPCTTPNS